MTVSFDLSDLGAAGSYRERNIFAVLAAEEARLCRSRTPAPAIQKRLSELHIAIRESLVLDAVLSVP